MGRTACYGQQSDAAMPFPVHRPRRLRATPELRALVRETTLSPRDFVWPLFFNAGLDEPRPVGTMPGVSQLPVRAAAAQAREAQRRGLGGVLLFGLPRTKDSRGSSALDPNGPVPQAVAAMKDAAPGLVVMTDVCVDEYTDHGHCGILRRRKVPHARERAEPDGKEARVAAERSEAKRAVPEEARPRPDPNTSADGDWEVDNDATLEVLAEMALVHARAGADVIAPSDMMDGRVGRIRTALDSSGYEGTSLLSYAVKYASCFYGPFREAADCAPKFGDRAGYQMDPANAREALREAALDEQEGADMLMVKPALAYLDVIHAVRAASALPLFAYNVSGEYAMLKAAAAAGMLDYGRAMMEVLTAIRRAGADAILTYHAVEAAETLGA
jgi:porphobilinogen synthase